MHAVISGSNPTTFIPNFIQNMEERFYRDPKNYALPVELGDVIAVLDAFGIGQAAIVGNSRGGQITFDTAIDFSTANNVQDLMRIVEQQKIALDGRLGTVSAACFFVPQNRTRLPCDATFWRYRLARSSPRTDSFTSMM